MLACKVISKVGKHIRKKDGRVYIVITKETIIGDILEIDSSTTPIFLEMGMHCLGCPASRKETIEQACYVHGQDADILLEKLNKHIYGK